MKTLLFVNTGDKKIIYAATTSIYKNQLIFDVLKMILNKLNHTLACTRHMSVERNVVKTNRSRRCQCEEESLELEHISFDHQKALCKQHYGGREAAH